MTPGQHIHIIGIGGSGMSAIARVLLQQGYCVSGSDRAENDQTRALAALGATIYLGHDAAYVDGADAVLITSAVSNAHVEVTAAHVAGIPIYKRSDIIAQLMRGQTGIAVAGTHGKTTTTSMIAHILLETGHDPSYIIGGVLRTSGSNAAYGQGGTFVIEADEYDHMFLGLRPAVSIITNVEWDHPDFFPTPKSLHDAFTRFAALLPADGHLIACADDAGALEIAQARQQAGISVTRYGIHSPQAAWRAVSISMTPQTTSFDVERDGVVIGQVTLRVPGHHNILNALAALITAHLQDVPFENAALALGTFQGAERRFDVRGSVGDIIVIDDYAHHPTAIRVTLQAAHARYPKHTIWAVWQPHTFSRTQMLFDDYLHAFGDAQHVLVTDIYASREQPLAGVSSAAFVAALAHPDARHTPTIDDAVAMLLSAVRAPAVILIMSAGDAPQIGERYLRIRQGDQR